ncbi:formylglycine-generating enzyme family protein [Duganella sp. S19_KUP01_CR8]|uniref:formylglycine-generating enzyme family protein n=1 Tax=Duganella sp. S19_KUP01_CR8 TaxID=3025502 RepID=UPI002FCD6F03
MKISYLLFPLVATCAPLHAAAGPIEPPMVTIKAGTFIMGSDTDIMQGRLDRESPIKDIKPAHKVSVPSFKLGKYEVTVKEFAEFVHASGYPMPTKCVQMNSKKWFDDVPGTWQKHTTSSSQFEPVSCIGWNEAHAYVQWLAKATGKPYRLPSEAEWEYAARGGTSSTHYWGAKRTDACRFANVADLAAEAAIKRDYDGLESKDHVGVMPCDDQSGYASVVGMYEANAYGLYDMIGNINEFVQDCYHDSYIGAPTDGSARSDGECKERVLRGGPWHWAVFSSLERGSTEADFTGSLEGFRVALSVDGKNDAPSTATTAFERELRAAQLTVRGQRKKAQ